MNRSALPLVRGVYGRVRLCFAGRRHRSPKRLAAVSRAVIGHDPLDADALDCQPPERAIEKADRALLLFVRQDLAVGQARGVVDADVQRFPADAVMPVDRARPAPGDTVANALDAPKLLGVEMNQ